MYQVVLSPGSRTGNRRKERASVWIGGLQHIAKKKSHPSGTKQGVKRVERRKRDHLSVQERERGGR